MSEKKRLRVERLDAENLWQTILPEISRAVRSVCSSQGRRTSKDEVDEFTQEIVLLLLEDDCRRLRSYDSEKSSLATWLKVVARHHVTRQIARQTRFIPFDEALDPVFLKEPNQEEALGSAQKDRMLEQALMRLTGRERQLFDLLLKESDATAVARQMNVRVETVYRRKHALVKKIQRFLGTAKQL